MVRLQSTRVFVSPEIEVLVKDRIILAKGCYSSMTLGLPNVLNCKKEKDELILSFCVEKSFMSNKSLLNNRSLLGTITSLLRSMLIGVSVGFIKKLQLVGVGYRVVCEKNIILLSVGFSHVISYRVPNSVNVICPTPVDIVLDSANKQLVGQVAADLRSIRPPESFTGKGIRYEDEKIRIKEVKKK